MKLRFTYLSLSHLCPVLSGGFLRGLLFCLPFSGFPLSVCSQVFTGMPVAGSLPLSPDTLYRDSLYRRVIKEGSARLSCYFSYPSGESTILKNYGNNAGELDKLDRFIRSSVTDTLISVRQVLLSGYSSIEGSYGLNLRLSRERANGLRAYLDFTYGLSLRYPVRVAYFGEDWGKLRELVACSGLNEKQEILMIIDQVDLFKGREKRLMDLNVGIPYRMMMKHYFPLLRRVEITVDYDLRRIIEKRYRRKLTDSEFQALLEKERAAVTREEARLSALKQARKEAAAAAERSRAEEQLLLREQQADLERQRQAAAVAARQAALEARKSSHRQALFARRAERAARHRFLPLLGLKTNLVSWAGVSARPGYHTLERSTYMPNLSAEFFFAERWSVCASATYADWSYDGENQFHGFSAYGLEPRLWLAGDGYYRLFYLGIYGRTGDYDLRRTDTSSVSRDEGNTTGTYVEGGLSAGCYLLFTARWGLDVSVRGGFRHENGKAYDIESSEYYYNHNVSGGHWGLTGINISLSYRFGKRPSD